MPALPVSVYVVVYLFLKCQLSKALIINLNFFYGY